ncbi:hypothetical protein Vretimale_4993 [Volvox reticuliferus]|uniref:Uncharacterized protein n=1 Tax=Volvox reticuliferus TaxID=1737510 RepID=A0A8J4C3H2_9CHLO|nr:hypothetical protein Vretifemale_4104 [Volvox reticuliferus]GIL99960.1 hypothetical protein Vretimale_4993 [Volvox reticuliferus]
MYSGTVQGGIIRDQEYAPLLFSVQPLDQATPRAATPLRADSSLSTQRRSITQTPGSMATDATPPPPPPIMRLTEDVVMDEPGSMGRGITPPRRQTPQQQPPISMPAPTIATTTTAAPAFEQPQPAYDDVWVTVFGFTQQDRPLVLREFHKCGDIVSWSFGERDANFIHIQYQNKFGAQRALIRNGEQLTGSLIVGVRSLDPRHQNQVASLQEETDYPAQAYRPMPVPERPYRVGVTAGQPVPQQNRSMARRVYEFVFGL